MPHITAICGGLVVLLLALSACGEEGREISLEEAKRVRFRVSVDGVGFDIPVNYHHNEFVFLRGRWPSPPRAQVEGRERRKVDYLSFQVVFPNLEPYTEATAAEFDKVGLDRQISVSVTHLERPNWLYYFEHVGPRLRKEAPVSELPTMRHYFDTVTNQDVYVDHNDPKSITTRIICDRPKPNTFPGCTTETRYKNDRFNLNHHFGLAYLSQWPEADHKLRALLDQFAKSAALNP